MRYLKIATEIVLTVGFFAVSVAAMVWVYNQP